MEFLAGEAYLIPIVNTCLIAMLYVLFVIAVWFVFEKSAMPLGMLVISVISPFAMIYLVFCVWTSGANNTARFFGTSMSLIAFLIFFSAASVARKNRFKLAFSDAAPADVVSSGIYSKVRHPLYSSYLLAYASAAISSLDVWAAVVTLLFFVVYYLAAVHDELVLLTSNASDVYETYRRRTGMFLPRMVERKGSYHAALAISDSERNKVFDLRTTLYRSVGKFKGVEPFVDRFDENALQIALFFGDDLVGGARIIAPAEGEEYEHDRFVNWDEVFPPKRQCVEVSRLSIVREHRSAEAISALFRLIGHLALRTRRRFIVCCATRKLVPFYQKALGGLLVGSPFVHEDLGPELHYFILVDVPAGIAGKTMPLPYWLKIWTPVAMREYFAGTLTGKSDFPRAALAYTLAKFIRQCR